MKRLALPVLLPLCACFGGANHDSPATAKEPLNSLAKIGSHFLHPDRILYGRGIADVELVYAVAPAPGFDFNAAQSRAQMAFNRGAEVYLRVDYQPGQTLPADEGSLQTYLNFIAQIASDGTLGRIRGLIAGNETNTPNEWRVTGQPLTAEWVARVVYGYGRDPADTSNVYQYAKTFSPAIRVFAPPVGPWNPALAGSMWYQPPRGRSNLSPWELYSYELVWKSYNNNWHAPYDEVSFAVHTYSRVGVDGTANGGALEPWSDVTGPYGAYWGTQWLDDFKYLSAQANGGSPVPMVISEWNSGTDAPPDNSYPAGLLQNVIQYVNFTPNVFALCQFVDQDYGGNWTAYSLTAEPWNPHIAAWNSDYDSVLRNGFAP